MHAGKFRAPVVVRLDSERGSALETLEDPRAAITALSRGVLGAFHIDWPGYQICLEKLGRAVMDPSPEALEEARTHLCALADHAETLVPPSASIARPSVDQRRSGPFDRRTGPRS